MKLPFFGQKGEADLMKAAERAEYESQLVELRKYQIQMEMEKLRLEEQRAAYMRAAGTGMAKAIDDDMMAKMAGPPMPLTPPVHPFARTLQGPAVQDRVEQELNEWLDHLWREGCAANGGDFSKRLSVRRVSIGARMIPTVLGSSGTPCDITTCVDVKLTQSFPANVVTREEKCTATEYVPSLRGHLTVDSLKGFEWAEEHILEVCKGSIRQNLETLLKTELKRPTNPKGDAEDTISYMFGALVPIKPTLTGEFT